MRADLALIGFGNVGRRFASLLDEIADRLNRDWDLSCRIVGTSTRRSGPPAPELIERLGQSDAPMRVVVETTTLNIADGRPAIDHVRAAIAAGFHVITANKGPAAFAYEDLADAAEAAGVSFLFEGAVMDGIPIFNLVRETMNGVEIRGFRGIVNTTTNHIISALEAGEAFAPALARMQAEGIAEADASLDVDGWDAAAKTAALANVLLHARITPYEVERTGIGEVTGAAARAAMANGARLRLVASASRTPEGAIRASVKPVEVPQDNLLAGIRGTANALVFETDLLGEVAVCQLAGDLTQTAYALVSDLIAIRRRLAPLPASRGRTLSPSDRRFA
jgi:homoserine dehydrogenase